ncbi:ester cyclase [Streptomyces vinaceus]|uniref:ester cyclase n=1 Tax=Streptomyces vinaceus TaxID=1960 RepID=UPI0035D91442
MVTSVDKNLALLRTAYRMMESGDLDACTGMLTEDFIANVPGAPEPLRGREIWRLGTQSMLEAFPDLQITVEEMFGVHDKVAARVDFRGTHRATFQRLAATDRAVSFKSIEMYRIEGDKIAEEWVSPDLIGLMQQITPAAAVNQ